MPKSDWEYFNCGEQHELDYVAGLYKDPAKVKEQLKKWCANGTISNSTHEEVYKMLTTAGFARK